MVLNTTYINPGWFYLSDYPLHLTPLPRVVDINAVIRSLPVGWQLKPRKRETRSPYAFPPEVLSTIDPVEAAPMPPPAIVPASHKEALSGATPVPARTVTARKGKRQEGVKLGDLRVELDRVDQGRRRVSHSRSGSSSRDSSQSGSLISKATGGKKALGDSKSPGVGPHRSPLSQVEPPPQKGYPKARSRSRGRNHKTAKGSTPRARSRIVTVESAREGTPAITITQPRLSETGVQMTMTYDAIPPPSLELPKGPPLPPPEERRKAAEAEADQASTSSAANLALAFPQILSGLQTLQGRMELMEMEIVKRKEEGSEAPAKPKSKGKGHGKSSRKK